MNAFDALLKRGIEAVRAGDRATARRLLSRVVRRRPDSEAAWLWLSEALDTPQGKAYCLERVLALDPQSRPAQKGLAALRAAPAAPVLVAQAPPSAPPPRTTPAAALRPWQQPRFWRMAVAVLAVIALSLTALFAYAAIRARRAQELALAAPPPTATPWPRGTLRPTFTATPTDTPTPTPTWTPTPTATPTATPRPRRRKRPTPTATPRPTLPPRRIDPRLTDLHVRIEPAFMREGQPYWRLVEARWTDERESAGKHSIFIEVLNPNGTRAVGQWVVVRWPDGGVSLPVENPPPPDWPVNFPMYNTLGSYSVQVSGAPSDRIVGLGLGTADAPDFTIHTSFYLVFQLIYR